MILANSDVGLYKFRGELIDSLLASGFEVVISLPDGEYIEALVQKGCRFLETPIDRRGTNPLRDAKLMGNYRRLLRAERPDVVLTYTVKPNVYGGLACGRLRIPYIANITGLGSGLKKSGLLQKVVLWLYKKGLARASAVFFQNDDNRRFFMQRGMVKDAARSIPGSGVNLEHHCLEDYPDETEKCRLLFIGRVMREKGIEELLECAKYMHEQQAPVSFSVIGACEEEYGQRLADAQEAGLLRYYGQQDDVHAFIREHHATVLPSYHEGLANVLLESASSGRPVLASRVPGCRETFDEGISGLGFEAQSAADLCRAVEAFLALPYEQKKRMGLAGREKMEREFSREIVIDAYQKEIAMICGTNKEKVRDYETV